ncbi:hypothetical protein CC85DRAFT_329019 [Cutaneotrichosporon oleaginosum]|uniref:Uncharacterized protein n=1 Tax=Cutaneotrichosporon oleaginosum TaxID=879819 RepID=A0A0J0XK19_9TREE|nr:uncharacterized protein CC85DRAFT_329019 [Cutaneotrichosporon oleaginosum]KLT41407.1 hypothetical protein CC85DRAFT_329019 [Cutaneotrichosporon oleaginosum]TXT12170.1 hypothetical protein COLE_02580 [Cutaneotrichosporon oleaginosum]
MEMDMDIGWCLACSKRTRDHRSPYCSDDCRQRDHSPKSQQSEQQAITSPLPPKFIPLPPTSANVSRNPSDRRSTGRRSRLEPQRPDPSPLVGGGGQLLSDETIPASHHERHRHAPQRDRRAFSFPASDEIERPTLPFARKAKAVNGTPKSFKKHLNLSNDMAKLALSTGANTPNLESPFESTSDSSNEQQEIPIPPRRSNLMPFSTLHPQAPLPSPRQAPPHRLHSPTSSSPVQTARPSMDTSNPITRMGSSSRSREDIMSWARNVGGGESSPDSVDDEHRGRANRNRPRSRRALTLANLPPPSTEPLDEPSHGSTPKGSVGALGALHMTFTPVVNAFRRVSVAAMSPADQTPTSSSLGLAVPAPAELSIVDVVVATRGAEERTTEGDTPALSTMSLSEVIDPSTSTDIGDTAETATDDFSIVSSSIDRRTSFSPRAVHAQLSLKPTAPAVLSQRRRSSMLPIPTPGAAFMSLSNYIRSLTPFALPVTSLVPSFTTSQGEVISSAAAPEIEPTVTTTGLTPEPSRLASPMPTTALQANLGKAIDDSLHERDLVRSVPMDIDLTNKAVDFREERKRELEELDLIKRDAAARPRSPPRADSRSSSPERDRTSGRPQSYDDNGDDDRRGRGRGRTRGRAPAPALPEPEPEQLRGRRRDRINESRDRSWSPARGRRPSRNRSALLAAFVGAD